MSEGSPQESAAAPRLKPRGSSQGGLRQYNERVVLQAIRLHGALPGADLARLTRLTPQTISLITKRLLDEGLLRKGDPVRGKIGQPSVPLALDPEGAYSVGIKVGRRSLDILLVDFVGEVRARWSLDYRFPEPDALLTEIRRRLQDVERSMRGAQRTRLQGIGIAAPLSMGGWQELLGMPQKLAERWREFDLRAEVAQLTDLPVTLVKDTTAACVAELVAGGGRNLASFLYVFVDTFIGGGLVIDSHLHGGVHGNAGAIGSMGLEPPRGSARHVQRQLLSVASLLNLERAYAQAGLETSAAADARAMQAPWLGYTRRWLAQAGAAIALSIDNASCLLDLDGVIVDGSTGRELLTALQASIGAALDACCWEGVTRPPLQLGTIGSDARALGGALLPLHANFAPDRDLFLKIAVE